jgi:hypothetical protein
MSRPQTFEVKDLSDGKSLVIAKITRKVVHQNLIITAMSYEVETCVPLVDLAMLLALTIVVDELFYGRRHRGRHSSSSAFNSGGMQASGF